MQDVFDFGIRNAQIVNSWSILFACDIHPDDPIAARMDTVYVHSVPNRIDFITKPLGHALTLYIQSK